MVGLGYLEDFMYKFYDNKENINLAKSFANEVMTKLQGKLYREEIETNFFLVGSGAKNLITTNGKNNKFDFDYNLEIGENSYSLKNNLGKLKDLIIYYLNEIMDEFELGHVQDSTSSITTKNIIYNNKFKFSIDICIVKKYKGDYYRLIHNKTMPCPSYFWNKAPNSNKYEFKVDYIKKSGNWNYLREKYLNRKNHYLKINDYNHPSFICYLEVVNDVYNELNF